ncbi:MAG: SDR family oxidoreductase [Candidatus Saganbacteria bacterium]|nr:SDR family oxidoreductase [Candidatus Saganbacteria bacterium]
MTRFLLTGGAGFIGSHLSDFLLQQGHHVICIDNLITGDPANIEHNIKNERFSFIRQDICRQIKIDGCIDCVLHFASPASPIDYLKIPLETMRAGSIGTFNTLDLAQQKNAKYLFASTSEIYGDPLEHPQTESYFGNVNSVGPRAVYDEAKRFSEALTMAYHRAHNVDTRIIRIFNTYGPRMRKADGRVIPNFINQALSDEPLTVYGEGKQTRSFCYVSDLVAGIYKLVNSAVHEPVNMGNPNETTVIDAAKKIIKLTGSKSKIVYCPMPVDDPKVRRPDISRAVKELGWQPAVDFEEGLIKTIKWFK